MIEKTLKQDDLIMKILAPMNVHRINRLICNTDQGALELEIRKGEKDYHFVLGAVPIDKEVSKELMDALFPITKLEVPQVNKITIGQFIEKGKRVYKDKASKSEVIIKKPIGRSKAQ